MYEILKAFVFRKIWRSGGKAFSFIFGRISNGFDPALKER